MKEQIEKQAIEELAQVLDKAKEDALATIGSLNRGWGTWYAEAVYAAGYRKQSEWISVEERLPEREGKYLVFTIKGEIKIEPYCTVAINYEPQFNYWVTHWMPLPEPPKGE